MKFFMEISVDGAAFADPFDDSPDVGREVARLLRLTAARIEDYSDPAGCAGALLDGNGASCGSWRFTAADDEG